MAYYAHLIDDTVKQVIVVSDTIENGAVWCHDTFGGEWVQTFDDGTAKFAAIGDTYDYATQTFISPPQPELIEAHDVEQEN